MRSHLARDAIATRDTSATLRLPRPAPRAYGLQRPLSFLVLRALSPHRSVGLVVTAVPFHRHYGLCLYRLPPLLFVLKAPPLAVLRSPHRVLRANRGATPRLPFLPVPAPYGCGYWHSPPRWGRAVGAPFGRPPFLSAPALSCGFVCRGFPAGAVAQRLPPCRRPRLPAT